MPTNSNAKYLLFVYEPYAKYHHVINQPFFANDAEMAFNHIMNVRKNKTLLYIDIFRVGDTLLLSKLDNQIPLSRLQGMFAEFEKEGTK